jgi:hypothetical protein
MPWSATAKPGQPGQRRGAKIGLIRNGMAHFMFMKKQSPEATPYNH